VGVKWWKELVLNAEWVRGREREKEKRKKGETEKKKQKGRKIICLINK
jgi:hypothetical protein